MVNAACMQGSAVCHFSFGMHNGVLCLLSHQSQPANSHECCWLQKKNQGKKKRKKGGVPSLRHFISFVQHASEAVLQNSLVLLALYPDCRLYKQDVFAEPELFELSRAYQRQHRAAQPFQALVAQQAQLECRLAAQAAALQGQQATRQPTQEGAQQPAQQPTQQATQEAAQQPTQQATQEVDQQPTQQATREVDQQPTQQATQEAAQQPTQAAGQTQAVPASARVQMGQALMAQITNFQQEQAMMHIQPQWQQYQSWTWQKQQQQGQLQDERQQFQQSWDRWQQEQQQQQQQWQQQQQQFQLQQQQWH